MNPPVRRSSSTLRVIGGLAHEHVTILADELSASLHPRLLDRLIRAVNDAPKDRGQSQLIFTTHDTGLLEGQDGQPPALRRDQVYFTKKDAKGVTELYRWRSSKKMHDPYTTSASATCPASTERYHRCRSSRYEQGQKAKETAIEESSALNEQLQRRRGVRDLAKRFLIVCEDDKSAPNYFEALKKHFSLSATSVEMAGSGGQTQPIQVVERAVDSRKVRPARKVAPSRSIRCGA